MKNKWITALLSVLIACFVNVQAFSQDEGEDGGFDFGNKIDQTNALGMLMGYSNIADQSFFGLRVQPELHLGKFGMGLDIPLQVNLSTGKLRTDEFKDGVGVLRMIRYVSWGVKKRDPLYIRLGDISGSYLGYGMLINNFTNVTSFDKRKVGLNFDFCIKNFFGVEGLYSDFDGSSLNLLGVRPYIKPFGLTRIPVLRSLEIGASYVTDHDKTGPLSEKAGITNLFTTSGMSGYGADIGLPLVSTPSIHLLLFAQYAMLDKNVDPDFELFYKTAGNPFVANYEAGTGTSVGMDFRFKILGNVLRMDTRLERLWYNDYFIPQFFDVNYEANRDARIASLTTTVKKQGIYGDLAITVLDKIRVSGGLMIPDNVNAANPALVKLDLDASQIVEKVVIKGTYIKGGLIDLGDAFKIDDRSLANVRVAYKLYSFLVVGVDYKWTWAVTKDGTFEASNYWTPYFGLSYQLPFGDK